MGTYCLAILLSYSLCFGALQKVAELQPVMALRNLGVEGDPIWKRATGWFVEHLFTCSYCMGFHTGWISWLVIRETMGVKLMQDPLWLAVPSWCLISAISCFLLDSVAGYLAGGE